MNCIGRHQFDKNMSEYLLKYNIKYGNSNQNSEKEYNSSKTDIKLGQTFACGTHFGRHVGNYSLRL